MTPPPPTDYREAFGLFDRVGDNKVAYNQIADIMRALGQNPTNKDVNKLLGSPSAEGKIQICLTIPQGKINQQVFSDFYIAASAIGKWLFSMSI